MGVLEMLAAATAGCFFFFFLPAVAERCPCDTGTAVDCERLTIADVDTNAADRDRDGVNGAAVDCSNMLQVVTCRHGDQVTGVRTST